MVRGRFAAVALGALLTVSCAVAQPAPVQPPAPAPAAGPPFPRLATIYSKGAGQNTAATQAAISRFNLYVADMINWPTRSAADPSITQGQYYKRQNPALLALMYFHSCLYSDTEYTSDQFLVGNTLYYIDPRWYLTYAGSVLSSDIAVSTTRLPVRDIGQFTVGERVMLGGGAGQRGVELAIVTAKSAPSGPGDLTVSRGAFSQRGRFAATDHAAGDYIRPVAHAFGSGEWMLLNPTRTAVASDVNPEFGVQTWNQFLASYLARKLDDPAFADIDGYMLDNFVDRASAFIDAPGGVDYDNTNTATGVTDTAWSEGMRDLAMRVRSSVPAHRIIMANDGGREPETFGPYLSGGMLEGIDEAGAAAMHGPVDSSLMYYSNWIRHASRPPTFIFNASPRSATLEAGAAQYQALRFLLTLALTDDGYFVFDDFNVDDSHQTAWWYDEYDNAGQQPGYLGQPLGPAVQVPHGVYRRDFAHGISLSNTTTGPQHVDLGGIFRKIKGRQVPSVNDGSQVTSVNLAPRDGLILLRT
jgi:hypothetical protein